MKQNITTGLEGKDRYYRFREGLQTLFGKYNQVNADAFSYELGYSKSFFNYLIQARIKGKIRSQLDKAFAHFLDQNKIESVKVKGQWILKVVRQEPEPEKNQTALPLNQERNDFKPKKINIGDIVYCIKIGGGSIYLMECKVTQIHTTYTEKAEQTRYIASAVNYYNPQKKAFSDDGYDHGNEVKFNESHLGHQVCFDKSLAEKLFDFLYPFFTNNL